MRRTNRTMLTVATLAVAVQIGGSVAWGAEPDEAFAASSGLFELTLPAGWVAEEHADGGGVHVAPASGGVSVDVTFIPRSVLHSGGLRMGAPAGAGAMAVAERMAVLIPPAVGVEAAEPALLDLASGEQAVELSAAGADVEGALYILESAPGVATIVSATSIPGGYADVRSTTLDVLASLVFTGSEDDLMGLLDPPPLMDIALG